MQVLVVDGNVKFFENDSVKKDVVDEKVKMVVRVVDHHEVQVVVTEEGLVGDVLVGDGHVEEGHVEEGHVGDGHVGDGHVEGAPVVGNQLDQLVEHFENYIAEDIVVDIV